MNIENNAQSRDQRSFALPSGCRHPSEAAEPTRLIKGSANRRPLDLFTRFPSNRGPPWGAKAIRPTRSAKHTERFQTLQD